MTQLVLVDTLNSQVKLLKKSTELGFGEAQVSSYTKRTRELIITRGSRGALDEEFALPKEEIAKAMTDRKARLDLVLENAKKPKENKAEGKAQDADSWDNFLVNGNRYIKSTSNNY